MQFQAAPRYSLQQIQEHLRQSGARLTPQRQRILEVFLRYGDGCHLSVEDIHRSWEAKSISLATIYRTVRTLHELGILREIDLVEGHKHYEIACNDEHHHHIVCLNCNKTIEFTNPKVNRLAQHIAKTYNIDIKDVELKIIGNCLDQHDHSSEAGHRQ